MYLKILHHYMLWSKNRGRNYTLVKSLGKYGGGVKTIDLHHNWASCWKNMGVDPIHPRRGILIKKGQNVTFVKLGSRNTTYFKFRVKMQNSY